MANVPHNDTLLRLNPEPPEAAAYWRTHVSERTIRNHVRAVTAACSPVSCVLALT